MGTRLPPPPAPPATPKAAPPILSTPSPPAPSPSAGAEATRPLITLDQPFDIDAFSQQLGETTLQISVPREQLEEVLRRVSAFMAFGIYVYEIHARPAPGDQLRFFIVTLRRIDYQAARGEWVPFEEKGLSDSPFGPGGAAP